MAAATVNLTIEQNATFRKRLIWKGANGRPIDLTGYTAKMQIRASAASGTVLLELSTVNSRISITPLSGVINLTITDEDTTAIAFTSGVYDLTLTAPDGSVTRLLQGKVAVSAGITLV